MHNISSFFKPSSCIRFVKHGISSASKVQSDLQSKNVIEPEAYMVKEKRDFVVQKMNSATSDPTNRLFAVVYVQNRQFKVMQDDLIHIEHNIPVDVGDEIKFEKILLVGGTDFTLVGRPLLDPMDVHVNATIIEKTTTSPEISYDFNTMYINNPQCEEMLNEKYLYFRVKP